MINAGKVETLLDVLLNLEGSDGDVLYCEYGRDGDKSQFKRFRDLQILKDENGKVALIFYP